MDGAASVGVHFTDVITDVITDVRGGTSEVGSPYLL